MSKSLIIRCSQASCCCLCLSVRNIIVWPLFSYNPPPPQITFISEPTVLHKHTKCREFRFLYSKFYALMRWKRRTFLCRIVKGDFPCLASTFIPKYLNYHILCVEKKNHIDTTEWFIALIICSTCFGHFYAHHQELETICVLLPPMVCDPLFAGCWKSGAG